MAHIGGSGTSASDPYIIDELEDLPPLLRDINNGINYIAFPEVYDGPKVFDMRAKGWKSNFLYIYGNGDGPNINKNVYFNGWTILGMSIKDGNFFKFVKDNSGSANNYVVRFYDLTIKNMYVIAVEADSYVFGLDASYGCRLELTRCKISCVLDAQYCRSGLFVNTIDEEEFKINECSCNVQFTNTSTSGNRRITIINDWHRSRFTLVNTIFSLNSRKWYCPYDAQESYFINCARIQFCKFIGNMKPIQITNDAINLVRGLAYSVYNTVDITLDCTNIASNFTIKNPFSAGVHVFNIEHITARSGVTITYDAANTLRCNDAQMIDADWLNERFFIVGDPPAQS